ncbi:hypothetical protein TNCV_4797601 [Trichonephila clavipes]|nr:hypothetical protein TNCV_4797601 [Trichonephila clavipes]
MSSAPQCSEIHSKWDKVKGTHLSGRRAQRKVSAGQLQTVCLEIFLPDTEARSRASPPRSIVERLMPSSNLEQMSMLCGDLPGDNTTCLE